MKSGSVRPIFFCFFSLFHRETIFFLKFSSSELDFSEKSAILMTCQASLSSRGLGHRVFIPATRVRIPVGMPIFLSSSYCQSPQSVQMLNRSPGIRIMADFTRVILRQRKVNCRPNADIRSVPPECRPGGDVPALSGCI